MAAVHAAGHAFDAELVDERRPPLLVTVAEKADSPLLQNFLQSSILKHELRHWLVVALDSGVCEDLPDDVQWMACVSVPAQQEPADSAEPALARPVNAKAQVLWATVKLGYDSLLVDTDVAFLQNPLPVLADYDRAHQQVRCGSAGAEPFLPHYPWLGAHVAESASTCESVIDLQAQRDEEHGIGAGFMRVKATPGGLLLLSRAMALSLKAPELTLQQSVSQAVGQLRGVITANTLPPATFPSRLVHLARPSRVFAYHQPCPKCVVVHSSWLTGHAAKVWRMKDQMLWSLDGPKKYYSDPKRKYIEYSNPSSMASQEAELNALKAAFMLGAMLDRTVILPEFRCHRCPTADGKGTTPKCSDMVTRCSLGAFGQLDLAKFAGAIPEDLFRERMFRYNPLTPKSAWGGSLFDSPVHLSFDSGKGGIGSLQASPEPGWEIQSSRAPEILSGAEVHPDNVLTPAADGSPTEDEVIAWFGSQTAPVLRFEHLYGLRPQFRHPARASAFDAMWNRATGM